MELDAKVCLCFHITRRKLLNFIRIERPCVASQLSQCGGAGTGCGWCVPFLKQLFLRSAQGLADLDALSSSDYELRRAQYIRAGKGTPPPHATPLPEEGIGHSAFGIGQGKGTPPPPTTPLPILEEDTPNDESSS